METIIQGGTIINEGRAFRGDIVLEDDHIAAPQRGQKTPPRRLPQEGGVPRGMFRFSGYH